jgi:hypothetical protein
MKPTSYLTARIAPGGILIWNGNRSNLPLARKQNSLKSFDFGNPLEIVREAISNAIDARASQIDVSFTVEEIQGNSRSVVRFVDNGNGMSEETLRKDFWGLGHSTSRGDKSKIGEKGHGTKIFLRSERVSVKTQSQEGAYQSECDRPLAALSQKPIRAGKKLRCHFCQ